MVQAEVQQLARDVMQALSQRDLPRLIELSAPDVEWRSFFAALGQDGVYRGRAGIEQYVADLADAWEVVRADVEDGLAVGELAVLVGHIHYRGRGSGFESESPAGWVLRFREGRLVAFRAFHEPERVLATVGLSE